MPLSTIQKGAIGQLAFMAAALVTGNGQLEAYTPVADNEERDAEVRRHLRRTPGIGIQIKVAFIAVRPGRAHKRQYLEIRFPLSKGRIRDDPRLWYFLAFYDTRQLQFMDPVFLVPSRDFHRMAKAAVWKGQIQYRMQASLAADSHDRWTPYRVALKDLGKRLLEIIDNARLTMQPDSISLPAGAVLVGRRTLGRQTGQHRRAA